MTNDRTTIAEIFRPGGLLAKGLTDYEMRPGQLTMAEAVAATLARSVDNSAGGSRLAVEAETGIGKTLAYLVPAVLSQQKVIVSTGTINLQEQILNHEIPFIRDHVDPGLKALCVKGRQNYLCLYRYRQLMAATSGQPHLYHNESELDALADWLEKTETGDRSEVDWLPDGSPLWREISATAAQCLGGKCPDDTTCFITRLRRQAATARLLIVNHHLFFSDLALRRAGFAEVLPRYESVIFDEAHHLENIATQYFGTSFSHYQLLDLVADIDHLAREHLPADRQTSLAQTSTTLLNRTELFSAIFPQEKGKYPLADFIAREPNWQSEVMLLSAAMGKLANQLGDLAVNGETWQAMEQRCLDLRARFDAITDHYIDDGPEAHPTHVRWFERREKSVTLSASPIEIAAELQDCLYSQVRSCIFTSGTLTVSGRFTYFLERLGLGEETETLSLPSPFDYANRTLLYIPDSSRRHPFPPPNERDFFNMVHERMLDILRISGGRALLLFTSFNAMHNAYDFLSGRLDHPLLLQGQAPKNKLLDTFQQQTDSVLLAVASFWEGVNVPGESLSCVIIDKLPFEVPSDPVIMARINKIREEGGNPFFDFQVPRAILSLRQGIGRLMRATTDRGLLAIMDVRLFTKGYGRLFRSSLPPSPVTRDVEDVRHFFADRLG